MSVEDSIVLGEVPWTDWQPSAGTWFIAAAMVLAVWVLLETLAYYRRTERARMILREQSSAVDTIREAEPLLRPRPSGAVPAGFLLQPITIKERHNTLSVQLQLLEQKLLVGTRTLFGKLPKTVHKLR